MNNSKQRLLYHAVAFLVAAIWGSTFVYTKLLLPAGLTPAQIFTLRFITRKVFFYGLLSMIPYFILRPSLNTPQLLGLPSFLWNLLFLGCVASTLCFLAWNWTMKKLGAYHRLLPPGK